MRAKDLPLRWMASRWADNFGAISLSIFCNVGLVLQALRLENVRSARSSERPVRSSATTVFSNVGFSELFATASTSLSWSAHAGLPSAGTKCSSLSVERRQVIRQRAFFEQWVIDWIGSGHRR